MRHLGRVCAVSLFFNALFGSALVSGALGCGGSGTPTADAGGSADVGAGADGATTLDAAPPVDCSDPGGVPPGTGDHGAVLDEERGRILAYGGDTAVPVMCRPAYESNADTWEYRLACGTWHRIEGASGTDGPGPRTRHTMVLDASRGRALLFGGRDQNDDGSYTNYADVWAFDLEANTWSMVATTGAAPSPRSNAAAVLDTTRDRLVVFGGNPSTSELTPTGTADTFALDLATGAWSEIATSGDAPSPRYYHGFTSHEGKLYVMGGTPSFNGPFQNDVWELDFATDTWRRVAGGGETSPRTRFGPALFGRGGRLIMAAGHDSTDLGNSNDLYALEIATGSWSEVTAGDILNGSALGPCRFPAEFTIPDVEAPERRSGFAFTQSESVGYVVWGKADCGYVNDVWSIDLDAPTWSPEGPATTSGEACNRSGATTCTELCF